MMKQRKIAKLPDGLIPGVPVLMVPVLLAAVLLAAIVLTSWLPDKAPAQQAAAAINEKQAGKPSEKLVRAAIERTRHRVVYDGAYLRLAFPMGDVPADRGVCTDVVIRAYRAGLGIDLQVLVNQDMKRAFAVYPNIWGLKRPDPNIDHRRVPNLEAFLRRHGQSLPITRKGTDYQPGDLVTWRLQGTNLPHIGIVTDKRSTDGLRPLIAHNIGAGPKLEDMLFEHPLTGHFRYLPR